MPAAYNLLSQDGEIVALIKPQFEAGRGQVGKKGVVRDKNVHFEVIRTVLDFATENGFSVLGLSYSPIKGPEGNIEYLAFIKKSNDISNLKDDEIQSVVDLSHEQLDK